MKRDTDISPEVSLIWNTANDVLRDIFQRTEYPDIIYPMVLIRRIESVLIEKKEAIKEDLKTNRSFVNSRHSMDNIKIPSCKLRIAGGKKIKQQLKLLLPI